MKKLIEMCLPGRPVRIKPSGTRPPGVPQEPIADGIILKAFVMPDGTPKAHVETDSSCVTPPQILDLIRLELLEVNIGILRKNLNGRTVHFPGSRGIGINFPKGASDHGKILGVNFSNRCLTITVGIEVSGRKDIWVTIADFTQCDLVPCKEASDE